jgi:hypothetical protein
MLCGGRPKMATTRSLNGERFLMLNRVKMQ